VKLTPTELAYVRSQGLYITEKCDGCGKALNQSVRYTVTGKPGIHCSAGCRGRAFFGDQREARKHLSPGRCAYCSGSLQGKKRGSIFCDDTCRMTYSRKKGHMATAEVEKSRTPPQSDQRVRDAKTAGKGNRITGAGELAKSAPGSVLGRRELAAEGWTWKSP